MRKTRKLKRLLSLAMCALTAFVMSGFLTGCSSYKKDMSLTYLLPGTVTSLDPQTAKTTAEMMVINSIFEGLCRIDEEGNAVPGAAQTWQASDNNKTFTFFLRDDAKWSEGEPVTAEDFVYGIKRALAPETKATGLEELFVIKNAIAVNNGETSFQNLGVYARDEKTVVFELEREYADFPALTATARFMPCREEFFAETQGHYGLDCVYTRANGPFTFRTNYSWEKGKYLDLARTKNYNGEHATVPEGVKFLMTDEEGLLEDLPTTLDSGALEMVEVSESFAAEHREEYKIKELKNSVCGLLLNTQAVLTEDYNEIPLNTTSLRSLYMRSIDRDELLLKLESSMREARSIMPDSIMWNSHAYNVGRSIYPEYSESTQEQISNVLAEISTERVPSISIICKKDEISQELANTIIVSWNKKLGNAFNIEPLDEETYNYRIASGQYQAAIYKMTIGGTLPLDVLKAFTSSASPQIYVDEDFDMDLRNSMFDASIYNTLELFIKDMCIFYPIYADESYYAVSPMTEEVLLQPDSNVSFSQTRKKEK